MLWGEFEAAAPEVAKPGRKRLEDSRVALLGTLRRDGSPRISPIEPVFAGSHLLLGVMTRSAKASDLLRDPRCVLHSAISDPDAAELELKLYGRVEEAVDEARAIPPDAWWSSRPREDARVYSLRIEQAALVA